MSSEFANETRHYPHAVLGDDIEYGALVVTMYDGRTHRFQLPDTRVFENLAPRFADVTGDAAPEVVVVESHALKGVLLAIYDETGLIAAIPFIDMRFRWLAPAGIDDIDGDGAIELAYIDCPHLAKTLRIWRIDARCRIAWSQQLLDRRRRDCPEFCALALR